MTNEPDQQIEHVLDFVSLESRFYILDALACHFRNVSSELGGNTPDTDAIWLARRFYDRNVNPDDKARLSWEHVSMEEKENFVALARACLRELPELCQRISSRYGQIAAALSDRAQMEDAQKRRKEASLSRHQENANPDKSTSL